MLKTNFTYLYFHISHSCLPNYVLILYTGVMAQWLERPPHDREVAGSNPGLVIPKTLKMVPTAFLSDARHLKNGVGQVKHAELPVDPLL